MYDRLKPGSDATTVVSFNSTYPALNAMGTMRWDKIPALRCHPTCDNAQYGVGDNYVKLPFSAVNLF